MTVSTWSGVTREFLEKQGIAWPDKHPDTGEPFAMVDGFSCTAQIQKVHHLPIGYPSRKVATAWETHATWDGEWEEEIEVATEWRVMDDEEWAAALAHYEQHKSETFGIVKVGPDIIEGRFEAASGSWAKGHWDGKTWFWVETATCFRR